MGGLRRKYLVAGGVAVALLAVSIATGAVRIPGPGGVIHACYEDKGGEVRLVGANLKCRRGESKLTWNQRGRAGPAGPAGPIGRAGADGAPGPRGEQGPPGTNGGPGAPAAVAEASAEPPPGYLGRYTMYVGGQLTAPMPLTRFGGCRLLAGGRIEDCHLVVRYAGDAPLWAWLGDAQGAATEARFRDVLIVGDDGAGTTLPQVQISGAFIHRAKLRNSVGGGSDAMTIDLTLTPRSVTKGSAIAPPDVRQTALLVGSFSLTVANLDARRVSAVEGFELTAPKVPSGSGFTPGPPELAPIEVRASGPPTTTDWDSWTATGEVRSVGHHLLAPNNARVVSVNYAMRPTVGASLFPADPSLSYYFMEVQPESFTMSAG